MPPAKKQFGLRCGLSPFHLAIPVHNVDACRDFYADVLGCKLGRQDPAGVWADVNFYGHQLVLHKSPLAPILNKDAHTRSKNGVDGDAVPVPHFGLCLTRPQFSTLSKRLTTKKNVKFILAPKLRFAGTPGAQFTMFFKDPSGNALEFKAMLNQKNLFAKFRK